MWIFVQKSKKMVSLNMKMDTFDFSSFVDLDWLSSGDSYEEESFKGIVTEFIRNFSLDEALHHVTYKPLSWGLRVQIALGVARALNYMHFYCMPPIAHSTSKAASILFDKELMPRVCDYSLAILRTLTNNNVKLKASEMAIADSGYIAPEHFQTIQPGIANRKTDVYAFGVLLSELLTGRRPFDWF